MARRGIEPRTSCSASQELNPEADPGIFVRGRGVQPSDKIWQAKKWGWAKREKGRGRGGGLQYLFCFSMVEIYFSHWNSFTDNKYYKYDIPLCFRQARHTQVLLFKRFVKCVSYVTVGGGSGGPPLRGDVKAVHQIKWHKTRIIGFIVRHFHKRTLKFDCHFASW